MPILTVAEALYGQSSSSDISVLCRISGVSAPVSIVTKTGQTLLLTTIHIGDDEVINNTRKTSTILQNASSTSPSSSSSLSTSLIKQSVSTKNPPPFTSTTTTTTTTSSCNTLISDEYTIINQNVGTFTYWGGLVAEAKLILGNGNGESSSSSSSSSSGNKSNYPKQNYGLVSQVPQPLCTGDIVLLIRVSRKVWMNKTTLQVKDGLSKIYVLSRQANRTRVRGREEARKRLGTSTSTTTTTTTRVSNVNQGIMTKKEEEEEEEEEEESDIFITNDQRKEMRSLLPTADARFLLDDIEGSNRIKRLFQMAKHEEPVISSVILPMQEQQHGRGEVQGGVRGGTGSLVNHVISTQFDAVCSEEMNPYIRQTRRKGGENGMTIAESQILPFDIESSGSTTRSVSIKPRGEDNNMITATAGGASTTATMSSATPKAMMNMTVKNGSTKKPHNLSSSSSSSSFLAVRASPLISNCSKIPLLSGMLFNVSCSIRAFTRSTSSSLPSTTTSTISTMHISSSSTRRPIKTIGGGYSSTLLSNDKQITSLMELGQATLVLPQTISQPVQLIILYSINDENTRLISGIDVPAPTFSLAVHLCDLLFKAFTTKDQVIISHCLLRDGAIYVTFVSDVINDSYQEDEEAFNLARDASQLVATNKLKQQQLEQQQQQQQQQQQLHRKRSRSVIADNVQQQTHQIKGRFSVLSIYLPALNMGIQQEDTRVTVDVQDDKKKKDMCTEKVDDKIQFTKLKSTPPITFLSGFSNSGCELFTETLLFKHLEKLTTTEQHRCHSSTSISHLLASSSSSAAAAAATAAAPSTVAVAEASDHMYEDKVSYSSLWLKVVYETSREEVRMEEEKEEEKRDRIITEEEGMCDKGDFFLLPVKQKQELEQEQSRGRKEEGKKYKYGNSAKSMMMNGWIECTGKCVEHLLADLPASIIAECVSKYDQSHKGIHIGEEEEDDDDNDIGQTIKKKNREVISKSIYDLLISLLHKDSRLVVSLETIQENNHKVDVDVVDVDVDDVVVVNESRQRQQHGQQDKILGKIISIEIEEE